MTARRFGERGSTLLVVAVVVVGVASLAVASTWSAAVIAQSRAQSVADLSALAAAAHGVGSASVVSRANGARVGAEREANGVFVVAVDLDDRTAEAAARACVPLGDVPGAALVRREDRSPAPCR